MNYSIFKSRGFWSVVGMFVVGGLNAIVPVLPAAVSTVVTGILGFAAIYFHFNPSQAYNTPQA